MEEENDPLEEKEGRAPPGSSATRMMGLEEEEPPVQPSSLTAPKPISPVIAPVLSGAKHTLHMGVIFAVVLGFGGYYIYDLMFGSGAIAAS